MKGNGASTFNMAEDLKSNRMRRTSAGSKRDKDMDSVNFTSRILFMRETFEMVRRKGKGSSESLSEITSITNMLAFLKTILKMVRDFSGGASRETLMKVSL